MQILNIHIHVDKGSIFFKPSFPHGRKKVTAVHFREDVIEKEPKK
jgi:hypothetical protein